MLACRLRRHADHHAGGYSVRASHDAVNVSEKAWAVLPPIAGFYERLSFVGRAYVCVFQAAFDSSPRAAGERPAISTARMAVRKMPSKVPAPPIEATGAPRP